MYAYNTAMRRTNVNRGASRDAIARRGRTIVLLNVQAVRERLARGHRSQNWLAREVGISRGYLSTLLRDGRAPSGRVRRRMQEVLGVEEFEELFALEHPA